MQKFGRCESVRGQMVIGRERVVHLLRCQRTGLLLRVGDAIRQQAVRREADLRQRAGGVEQVVHTEVRVLSPADVVPRAVVASWQAVSVLLGYQVCRAAERK